MSPITVGFVALGCPKNIVDSERMLAQIAEAGFLITDSSDNADVVIINTCGFIEPAKAEALEVIKHAVDCKLNGTVKKVIVAGCLSERLGSELFNENDDIDAIAGLEQRDSIVQVIKETLKSKKKGVYFNHSPQKSSGQAPTGDPEKNLKVLDDRARLLITPGHWAYLRISEGCDHRCSFCTIPSIRGPFRSKPQKLILDEAAELADAGVVELNIIAQDTTYYGRDLKIKDGLSELLKKLEKIKNLVWLRLMYLHPAEITDKLIETIAENPKIVHYVDVPVQHINNEILKIMRRSDTKQSIRRLIEKLRKVMPDIILRTTLMVGFPGETEQQFNELLEFVKWAEFDALGCFTFFPESGTPAAEMPNQVSSEIKQQRLEELMLTQQQIAFAKNKRRIGDEVICLVDTVDDEGIGRGRFYGQAPEIDSLCIIKRSSAQAGQFVDVKVTGMKNYDLVVEQI